jgi:hypothetical protein
METPQNAQPSIKNGEVYTYESYCEALQDQCARLEERRTGKNVDRERTYGHVPEPAMRKYLSTDECQVYEFRKNIFNNRVYVVAADSIDEGADVDEFINKHFGLELTKI